MTVIPLVTTEARLNGLLEEKGLRKASVARRMGISGAQLTRLFKGQRTWNILTARAFAMATGIPLDAFYEGDSA